MVDLQMSLPLDEDGFVEMECDYCKNRFMIHESVYSDDQNLHFFCPICGLPNDINTFYCPEVLELAQQKAVNYMNEELRRQLSPNLRKINKHGLIKLSLEIPKQEPEKELFTPSNEYISFHQSCCGVDVKTLEFDSQIGVYCPVCGGATL